MHKKRLKEEELKVVKEFPNLLSFFYGEINFPLERITRFELVTSLWKSEMLPLHYTRIEAPGMIWTRTS